MRYSCEITAEAAPQLAAAGLVDFESVMTASVGELMSREKGGRELRRLTLAGPVGPERYYLKRLGRESALLALRMVLFGRRPRSGPLRELELLKRLRSAGFAAMEAVAWGEQSRCGLPLGGFLVVREVPGDDVARLFRQATGGERRRLMFSVGNLIGRLHAAGFYHPVRFKDLIQRAACDGRDGELVLIDRETSKPWPSIFSQRSCLRSLARTARRTLRDGHRPGAGSVSAFLHGYARGVADRWPVTAQQLIVSAAQALRYEISTND